MTLEMPDWDRWKGMSEELRQYELHRTLAEILVNLEQRQVVCGKRFDKLERRRKWNTAESFGGGILGGIMAIIGSWAFWRG